MSRRGSNVSQNLEHVFQLPVLKATQPPQIRQNRQNLKTPTLRFNSTTEIPAFKKITKSNFQKTYNIKTRTSALNLFNKIDTVPNTTFNEPITTEYSSNADFANSLLSAFARSVNIQLTLKEEQMFKRQQEMVIKTNSLAVWFDIYKNQTVIQKLSNSPEKLFADMLLNTPISVRTELEEKLMESVASWDDVREMRERFFEDLPCRLILLSLSRFYNVSIALVGLVGQCYKMLDKVEVLEPFSVVFIKSTSRRNTGWLFENLMKLAENDLKCPEMT